jgi:predicted metalloprotease with PDZ domain
MFVLPEEGAASEEALKSFLAISAHEFFHVWNVKRLRPAALWPYRYDREAYTRLHWLTEGVTDYYTSLSLARAGLISPTEFWGRLSADLTQIENTLAYRLFSPAELSIDSWLVSSSYRPSWFQGSFYSAGKRVGFLLDMVLRRETGGKISLDSLLRYLYARYYKRGKGIPEDGVEQAAIRLGGPALKTFFSRYVEGRESPPYKELLEGLPLQVGVRQVPLQGLARIGIMRTRPQEEGLKIEEVLPGSLAERAGIEPGDLLLTVQETAVSKLPSTFWETLSEGMRIEMGWSREGFPLEGQILFRSAEESRRTEIRLNPLDERFLIEF